MCLRLLKLVYSSMINHIQQRYVENTGYLYFQVDGG